MRRRGSADAVSSWRTRLFSTSDATTSRVSVGSGQWAVGSGQSAVGSRQVHVRRSRFDVRRRGFGTFIVRLETSNVQLDSADCRLPTAYSLDGVEGAAADEDGEAAEHGALGVVEQ